MKKNFIVFTCLGITLIACGKQGEKKVKDPMTTPWIRNIDPLTEGSFSTDEKALGSELCAALKYKRENFLSLHGTGAFPKTFLFSMKKKGCENNEPSTFNQSLIYSGTGGLSYAVAFNTGVTIVPAMDTDAQGVFTTYCANKTQNARVFNNGSEYKIYHFASGELCGGDATQICAVYERAPAANPVTTNYKMMIVNRGAFLGHDLRGQEVKALEQVTCGGQDFQSFGYGLTEVKKLIQFLTISYIH